MATADFTIADVLAWARTKPADEAYNYGSNNNCALCQFLRETGRCERPSVGGTYWRNRDTGFADVREFPTGLETALLGATFGDLVKRLQALCPETPVTSSNWAAIDAYLTDIEQVEA
jgi:hypothetical protein